ncbi:MAG: glycoside hydrolase family 32 protein [Gammaproteobacteria bacterium]|nr:glycoside hydrolase family 32 protein [Gammaproteobacteria bacterium]
MSLNSYVLPDVEVVSTGPEKYRPKYHYTADKDWLSDPNGMVFHNGEFHLCYQHDAYDKVFGAMSWGHAVSKDLLHWQELPKVVEPDEHLGMCFSGCMVVDKQNTSGLGENALVGFYTSELPKQQQSMFYSTDSGRTFQKYAHNPVIRNTEDMSPDFRDPKVMWYEPRSLWVMALAGPERIEFWSSPNLIDWQLESWFGEGMGAHGGEWECPDLRRLPLDGDQNNCAWILIVSVNPGGPNGGCGTQYFIGDFSEVNGKLTFTSEQSQVKWLDWGIDNYAGVGWTNMEESPYGDRLYSIGWMNNWIYAYKTPTSQWRGVMTMIRELKLETIAGETILTCLPASFYSQLLGPELPNMRQVRLNHASRIGTSLSSSRVQISFADIGASDVGIELANDVGEVTRIGYSQANGQFYIDRTKSGNEDFAEGFAGVHTAMANREHQVLKIEVFIDRCSVEVFFNDGEYAMTELIYPDEPLSVIKPYGEAVLSTVNIRKMLPIKRTPINE